MINLRRIPALLVLAMNAMLASTGMAEVSFSGQAEAPEHNLALWNRAPATNWMT